jgi:hypothetical protein
VVLVKTLAAMDGGGASGRPGCHMSARELNSSGGSDSDADPSERAAPLICQTAGQVGGASAFWLTVAAGTFPSHLSSSMERIDGRPELPDLVTRELEMSNPDLLRLFKLQ